MEETPELLINNFRMDGRKLNEIRDMIIKTGIVQNAAGSCSIEMGGTKVLAWIKAPKEARSKNIENIGSLRCDFILSQSSYPYVKAEIKRDLQMREFSSTLKEIFEEVILLKFYPRSEIEINVTVLQNDGSYKSIAITAVTMALINAGIFLKDTAIGVTVGLNDDAYLVDLTKEEENAKIPILNSCFLPNLKKIVFIEITNSMIDYSKSEQFINSVEKVSDVVYQNIKQFLIESFRVSNIDESNLKQQNNNLLNSNDVVEDEED